MSPPTCSSTATGMNQEVIPGPVAIASQTCSGVPGTSISAWISRSVMRVLLGGVGNRMGGDDEPVRPPCGVVVLRREAGHGGGEVVGEGGAVGGRGERDLAVDRERRQARSGLVPGERADLADQPRGERDEVAGRQAVACAAR